ncbi:MAG: hypothetical protein AAFX51_15290 [Cyanobacteria bacterium J06636_28]
MPRCRGGAAVNRVKPWGRLSQLNRLLFGLLGNPAVELPALYGHLSQRQALRAGCFLAMLGLGGFTLGGYVYVIQLADITSAGATLGRLWLSGCATFFSLIIILAFSRLWLRRHGTWASDTFIAGATLFPTGMFTLVSPMALPLPWLWVLLFCIALHHTFLTLYNGCHQIHHYPEVVATWLAPSFLFICLTTGYVAWHMWG